MYSLGRRSLVAAHGLAAGQVLQRGDLAVKRPGTGIAVHELDIVIGRRAKNEIEADQVLSWADLA
ncbi:MAG: SAF domain-containing protein [Nocardioidaceae bacterium]